RISSPYRTPLATSPLQSGRTAKIKCTAASSSPIWSPMVSPTIATSASAWCLPRTPSPNSGDPMPTGTRSARFEISTGQAEQIRRHATRKKDDKFQLVFECLAEDHDHAEEQALNAYPRGEIIHIMEAAPCQHRDDGRERCTRQISIRRRSRRNAISLNHISG